MKIHFWKHPISVFLLLDLSWTLLSSFFSELPIVSIKRLVIKSLFILIFFYLIPLLLKKRNLFLVYGLGFIVPIIWATYKHYLYGFGYEASLLTSVPFYDEHAVYAACSAFILPYFLLKTWKQKQQRLFHFLISVLFILALLLSYSRAAWISIIVSILFWILIELKVSLKQYKIMFALSLLTLLVSFNPIYENFKKNSAKYNDEIGSHLVSVTNLKDDASNLERINRWICAIEIFKDNPAFGSGPGTYQFVYDRYQHPENMTRISTHHGDNGNAHSEYFMALSENGLFGFLIFLGIVITSFKASIKLLHNQLSNEHKALVISALLGLITFYTHGLFNSFIDSSKMSILVYGSLGIIASIYTKVINERKDLELMSD
ncbi:MAG: O-antigen ligase family protein [Salibacteraceae bacterium]